MESTSLSMITQLGRALLKHWRILFCALAATYVFSLLPQFASLERLRIAEMRRNFHIMQAMNLRNISDRRIFKKGQELQPETKKYSARKTQKTLLLSSQKYGNLWIEHIVGDEEGGLQRRMVANVDQKAPPKVILSFYTNHGPENLNGCLDWNCIYTTDEEMFEQADAILLQYSFKKIFRRRRKNQYIVFFSQESPQNTLSLEMENTVNMSLNFRRDSPASSPYGYAVKLAPESYRKNMADYKEILLRKTKPIAWFVSNCNAFSGRDKLVSELQKYIAVDIYGKCGTMECEKGAACEDSLDSDYYFYIAFENSICKDYATEKLWSQGYQRKIVPLVLKRRIVEPFVPPYSFIAVDDFNSAKEMAEYLKYLMDNKTAYMEYFAWRETYEAVFLDGINHDELERPWGFCQLCRLLWQEPRETYIIEDFNRWWDQSCYEAAELISRFLPKDSELKDEQTTFSPIVAKESNGANSPISLEGKKRKKSTH